MCSRILALALLLLLSSSFRVHSQFADISHAGGPVPITAAWRFHTGDDPSWARPDFDDSSWPLLQTGKSWSDQGYPDYYGFAWYRIRVQLPESSAPLGIELGTIYTSAEVYVDGELTGMVGQIQPRPRWNYAVGTNVVRLTAIRSSSTVIAVRFWEYRDIAHHRPGGFLEQPRIGPLSVLEEANFSRLARWLASHSVGLAVDSLAVVLGLFSLGLFVLRTRSTEYAWGSAWLLSYAAVGFTYVIGIVLGGLVGLWQPLGNLLLMSSFMCYLVFIWRFLGEPEDFLLRTGIVLADLGLLARTFQILRSSSQLNLFLFVLVLLITVIIFQRLIRSALAGSYEALLLLVPFVLMTGTTAASEVAWVLFTRRTMAAPELILYRFGFFSIHYSNVSDILGLMALGAALVLRFTRLAEHDERLSAELEAAHRVQAQLVHLRIRGTSHFAFDAAYRSAGEVGGDFYQIFPRPDGSVILVIGDVCGKGLGAAMRGTMVVGALRSLAEEDLAPAQILVRLNAQFVAASDEGFVTCLCARLTSDGVLTVASAGHLPPYLNGSEVPVENGLPLGILPDSRYFEMVLALSSGDRLTFLSDGVVEAQSESGELFGFDRTRAISTRSAEEIALIAQQFGQQDDITVLRVAFVPGIQLDDRSSSLRVETGELLRA